MRCADPFSNFIKQRRGQKTQAGSKHQHRGMAQTRYNNNPEGKRGSLIDEQYPEGLTTGVIQKHER